MQLDAVGRCSLRTVKPKMWRHNATPEAQTPAAMDVTKTVFRAAKYTPMFQSNLITPSLGFVQNVSADSPGYRAFIPTRAVRQKHNPIRRTGLCLSQPHLRACETNPTAFCATFCTTEHAASPYQAVSYCAP